MQIKFGRKGKRMNFRRVDDVLAATTRKAKIPCVSKSVIPLIYKKNKTGFEPSS